MKTMNYKNQLFILSLLIVSLLSSCVGTIKNADPESTKTVNSSVDVIASFEGIALATPIAHNKVEVFFNPALQDVDKYAYVIVYDKLQTPIYVAANSLAPDYRGYVKYTVRNLDPNTSYIFSVQIRDISTLRESSNSLKIAAKTFANTTANFNGISEVRNLSGSAGLNGIEVFWPEAEALGGLASDPANFPGDPDQYVVTVINSNYRTPADMNNEALHEPDRKVITVTATNRRSMVVNGLDPDTKYYVQVRCIQRGLNVGSNSSNINYKKEENTSYLEIKTYSANLANLQFQADKFFLTWPPNNAGLFALKTNWIAPIGNFDHYRIYYARKFSKIDASQFNLTSYLNSNDADPLCYDVESSSSVANPVYCQEANTTQTNAIISGLDPNAEYNVVLMVCITSSCKNNTERVASVLQSKITSPNIANFDGLKQIIPSNDLSELNTMKLIFNAPIYNSGTISGFLVDYYETINTPAITLNDGSISSPPVTVDPFDYHVSCPTTGDVCTMTVRGVDINSANNFCFSVYPFSYDIDGSVIKASYKNNLIPVCASASLLSAPTSVEFPGFKTTGNIGCDKSLGYGKIALDWDPPLNTTTGIYDKYEIFYTSVNSTFSFKNAQSQFDAGGATTYGRIVVDRSISAVNITNLDPTKKYIFGINTYYNSPNQILRSGDNSRLKSCDFPNMP